MTASAPRIHAPRLSWLCAAVLLAAVLATNPVSACEAPVFAQYRSQSPLLAETPDSALQVSLHEDGCVQAHFPRQDLRAGTHAWQLPTAEWSSLQAALRFGAETDIDVQQLRHRLQMAKRARAKTLDGPAQTTLYVSADENLIEFVLPADAPGKHLRGLSWQGLHADQRMLPDDPDLARIVALVARFEGLADFAHQQSEAR
jgi:hypothetical protein